MTPSANISQRQRRSQQQRHTRTRIIDVISHSHYAASLLCVCCRYVFGGCCEVMTNLLVKSLVHLQDKRVNSKGVAKICRNFFALQENMNNIDGASGAARSTHAQSTHAVNANNTHLQESHFDRARQYYELLNYSQEVTRHGQDARECQRHFGDHRYSSINYRPRSNTVTDPDKYR
jgi:hypothetical protein